MTFPVSDIPDADRPAPDKAALRAAMRQQRRDYAASLDTATRAALEDALVAAIEPLFATVGSVAAYAPMTDEISPLAAMARAKCVALDLAFPFFVDRDSRMTFRAGAPVDPGPWGILQPAPDADILSPDLILMPLVAVDAAGTRIGMGKGHYDRALPGLRDAGARLVGCGWGFQRIDQALTPDPWDVPLDAFASPDGLEMFR
jgi:5-formyltetrahydrofolate cyclo-ligase